MNAFMVQTYLFGVIKWFTEVTSYEISKSSWQNSYSTNNVLNIYENIWIILYCAERDTQKINIRVFFRRLISMCRTKTYKHKN